MNKEIEEIASIVDTALRSKYEWTDEKALEVADELVNKLSYRKQVWHKIAEGDLPAQLKYVLCFTEEKLITVGFITEQGLWYLDVSPKFHNNDDIIAWTELPKYTE